MDEESRVLDHWARELVRVRDELKRWDKFHENQKFVRRDTALFNNYIKELSKHMREAGVRWTVQLQRRPRQQRKFRVDDWKEYYIYEHRKYRGLGEKLQCVLDLPESNLDRRSDRWLHWNGGVTRARSRVEKLESLLEWISGQLLKLDAELATWQGRLRRRREPAMTKGRIEWEDRLRQRRGAVIVPLERPTKKTT
jgi:hypothetical protein